MAGPVDTTVSLRWQVEETTGTILGLRLSRPYRVHVGSITLMVADRQRGVYVTSSGRYLRYNLILQAAEEKDRHLLDAW
jgi:hypothetical protein